MYNRIKPKRKKDILMKKIRIALLLLSLLALLLLSACEIDLGGALPTPEPDGEHECDFKLSKDLSYPATCKAYGKNVYKCSCGKTDEEILPYADHTPAVIEGILPTCEEKGATEGSYCSVCNTVLKAREEIDALGHTEVIDPATDAVGNTPAKTEGKHCSVCGKVLVKQEFVYASDFSDPDSYDSDYSLNYLKSLPNGEKYATLYERIDAEADYFHSSTLDAASDLSIAEIDYSDLGISSDEALAVWAAYKTDRPLYYWISGAITYTSRSITLAASEEYKNGAIRAELNSDIYDLAKDIIEATSSSSAYLTALSFHDHLIANADYKYKADGITPADDSAAHCIIGVMLEGAGVCESYAKAFQLLLNYCGIENAFVTGFAGEAHAWNAVKLDDGKWYWCDLTWDDEPAFMWGISYRYFMVTGGEDLSKQDGPWTSSATPFDESHTPDTPSMSGTDFAHALPEISATAYQSEGMMLRDEFTVDGLTYAVVGYGAAALVRIERDGEIEIPERVSYLGDELSVIAVGAMVDGLFAIQSIAVDYSNFDPYEGYAERNITKITVPKSVIFIWDNAFVITSLKDIEVAEDNPAFTSRDGVLFTKDLSVLVKYPSGKEAKEYTLPDETEYIAYGAFSMLYSNVTLELERINLGESFILAGFANRGYGYDELDEVYNLAEGELERIKNHLSGSKTVA